MFGFIKKTFFTGLKILSCVNPLGTNQLNCISKTNQACKVRQQIVNIILLVMSLYFILLVLKQVNAVVVVTISMIHMQKCVFLML